MALTFADTHNMIVYLTKSDAGEGFEQILDFLKASVIKYALTVIITEDTVREALRLDDAESIDCLPNEEIFAELQRIGTVWNEFSLSMASAVICLATCRKFNFSKYIFDNLVRNVDSSSKFYMYPRFLQLMIRTQVSDLSSHTTKYSSPALTQKVFANMRRVGKGFFGVDTPLFEGMLVPQQAADDVANVVVDAVDDVVAEDADEPTIPSPTPTTTPPSPQDLPSTSQILLWMIKRMHLNSEEGEIAEIDADEDVILEEVAAEVPNDADVLSMQDDESEPAELNEVIEVVTTAKLMTKVVTDAATTTASTITSAYTITAAPSAARRRKGVVIRDPEEIATPSTIVHSEPKSKDKGKGILVKEPKRKKEDNAVLRYQALKRKEKEDNVVLRYQALKRKPQKEAQARKNMIVYLKNMAGFKMEFFRGMRYDDIRPIFEKHFNYVVGFLEKSKEQLEEEASRALKRKTKSSEQQAAKKQKLDEEVEKLKKHLQIVPNDEDDVYTEATPLALKVHVVDYQIHTKNNKPYYKIIRANGTHQLFLSFLSFLRNFDTEDLEMLWKIVQDRFESSKPKNFSDDFMLNPLKAMFEKPDVEAQV
nr:hypothetical protein [Tanacetum cinerariifolium]